MSSIFRITKKIYRAVLPGFIRGSFVVTKLKGFLSHSLIYDSEYYDHVVEGPAIKSAGVISDSIIAEFKPKRVIDVGCGTGALLEALREKGCEVKGLEYSNAALEYCRARQLNVSKFNLGKDIFNDNCTFDVAISIEVAEHLPERVSDRYIDLLTKLSHTIIFTAAPPGQGGKGHVNEHPPSYWLSKYRQRGFEYNVELSNRLKESWKAFGSVQSWYFQNLMIFRKL